MLIAGQMKNFICVFLIQNQLEMHKNKNCEVGNIAHFSYKKILTESAKTENDRSIQAHTKNFYAHHRILLLINT